ncbi:hypothetical protein N9P98_00005, partial [Flavobacteriaceae bacterium]|nr:hypothetical protein [Flavobacteriaceae bacterium]
VAYIKKNPTSFDELFDLACAAEKHREHIVAAWVFEHYILQHIESSSKPFCPPIRTLFLVIFF